MKLILTMYFINQIIQILSLQHVTNKKIISNLMCSFLIQSSKSGLCLYKLLSIQTSHISSAP